MRGTGRTRRDERNGVLESLRIVYQILGPTASCDQVVELVHRVSRGESGGDQGNHQRLG